MINNSGDAFFCPRSLSINMLQNKYVTHYFWNTGSHILFIQQVCLQHNSRQSIRIILIGWEKYNRPMKIFRRNSFGCCNVNKGLQTKDGRDDFWKLFCEILFLKHSAAQEPWTKKRDGTIVYHDITELYTYLSMHW